MSRSQGLWQRQYALPAEHGAWIWLLGPLAIGLAAGGRPGPSALLLLSAGLAAFLLRQPVTMVVKVMSRRRRRSDLRPSLTWALIYSGLLIILVLFLVRAGHSRLLWLAAPGIPVFLWHLWLVSRRAERRQVGVELVGAGVLALTAPAGYWVAGGQGIELAALLWLITWLQAAASILLVYLRLAQRDGKPIPGLGDRLRAAWRPLLYHLFNLGLAAGLSMAAAVPWGVTIAFGLLAMDALDAALRPAENVTPTRIGLRQLSASLIFVLISSASFLLQR